MQVLFFVKGQVYLREMKCYPVLLAVFVFSMVVLVSFGAEVEVKPTELDIKNGAKKLSPLNDTSILKSSEPVPVANPTKVDKEKKGETQEVASKEVETTESAEMKMGDKKETLSNEAQTTKVPPVEGKEEKESVSLKPLTQESAHGEECGPTNKCTNEKNKLVACLRVPGDDSPGLSLLVQNKGTSPLTVDITASTCIRLENTSVQLKPNEHSMVKVEIGSSKIKSTSIILKAKGGQCSIDTSALTLPDSLETAYADDNYSFTEILTKTPVLYIFIAAILVIASVWTCVRFRRRNQSKDDIKYQKIEIGLPVSGGGKVESEGNNDGWDAGWGDGWDDEEAPKTPSMPVTPSLSSKGLASRKPMKDAWKD